MAERILIVDDEPNITSSFSSLLTDEGYRTTAAGSAEEAQECCRSDHFDLVLLDLHLPAQSGIDFLRGLAADPSAPAVLVISGQSDIQTALSAIKLGAIDYLDKPVQPEKLITSVRSSLLWAAAHRQRSLLIEEIDSASRIIGASPPIRQLLNSIKQAAPTDVTVLITGENGTGKELVATRLYLESTRREKPFVKVNCPGIPSTLFESELFGHTKGAFTGAVSDYPGKFALADGGTIFLDEIGDLPIESQAKLLRVLETGEVEPLGAVARRSVDVRVICASNRQLPQLISQGTFREDLFYRISVFTIHVPPLRKRLADVPLLVGEFLRRFDPGQNCKLDPDVMAHLATLDYPGNVRELKNIVERLTILCRDRTANVSDITQHAAAIPTVNGASPEEVSLASRLARFEKSIIQAMLAESKGNIAEAARRLQIERASLSRKIKQYELKKS